MSAHRLRLTIQRQYLTTVIDRNIFYQPGEVSRSAVEEKKKATQLPESPYPNQPNNHHNNPTEAYTFFVETQSYNWHLIGLILKGLRKFGIFEWICRSKLLLFRPLVIYWPDPGSASEKPTAFQQAQRPSSVSSDLIDSALAGFFIGTPA